MNWRRLLLSFRLGPTACDNLKVKIAMKRSAIKAQIKYKTEDNPLPGSRATIYKYASDYDKLGPRVDILFPLVAPNLDFCTRLEKHKNWYQLASDHFDPKEFDIEQQSNLTIHELADAFPQLMPFIPTSKVLQKMILRSTQIKLLEGQTAEQTMTTEINHKEKKRAFDENNVDEPIHPIYQQLRVLPPTIEYPEIENNWPGFFEEVNLMHLANKYKPY